MSLIDDCVFEDSSVLPLNLVGKICFSDKRALSGDSFQDHRRLFVEVQVNNSMVAVSVIQTSSSTSTLTSRIVLVNMDTLTAVALDRRDVALFPAPQ